MTRDGDRHGERPTATRRAALGTIGTLPFAGCAAILGGSPELDGDRLAAVVHDPALPTVRREPQLPVTDDYVDAIRQRVDALLEPIPRPVDAETVPNGAIRNRLESRRERARDRAESAADEATNEDLLDRLRAARRDAAAADGIWTAIEEGRTRADAREGVDDLRADLEGFDEDREYRVGDDPIPAVIAYDGVTRLITEAADELDALETDEAVRSLAVGELAAQREVGRAAFEDARHVYSTFVDSLGDREATETSVIPDAAASLESTYAARRESIPILRADVRERVDPDINRDSALGTTLDWMSDIVRDAGRVGLAAEDEPARYVRAAVPALAVIEGFDRALSRIDSGDPDSIEGVDDVADARRDAIAAIESLLADDPRPLERWLAAELVERLERPDDRLSEMAGGDVSPDATAEPLAFYYVYGAAAREAPAVVDTVYDAF